LQRILTQWQLLSEDDSPSSITSRLGIQFENVRLRYQNPADGIAEFLNNNDTDLLVLATHGRDGLDHWLRGSIAETVFRRSLIPALFIPMSAHGFVNQISGDLTLRRILLPVDHSPEPDLAIQFARQFANLLVGREIGMDFLHIGDSPPRLQSYDRKTAQPLPVMVRSGGDIVQNILDASVEFEADLICMATAGHHGVFDALRGSTTERVLRHAPRPLLTVAAR
jgi:nucleotide-binding universal stress UspA family protein